MITTGKYISFFVKDLLTACGFLTVLAAVVLALSSTETINGSLFMQLFLGASAFTCFRYALVNTHEVEKRVQTISFYIFFILADVFVILWMWLFATGPRMLDHEVLIPFVIVILLIKTMVYTMMHIDGKREAKQLNQKLEEYKKDGDKSNGEL
jgi:amino acid transporter